MPLIAIPPYLLTGDEPPSARSSAPSFHRRSYQIPPPIDFPRDLFAEALTGHARLLETHGSAILAAPQGDFRRHGDGDSDGEADDDEDRFVALDSIDIVCSLLVSEGVAHEIHRLHRRDISYIVQRCRGIVRQLMEAPPDGCMYVVVVARDVASLHLTRAIAPRRAGDCPRLEVIRRDLVFEPWDQWHLRAGGFVVTWWKTPAGELVGSRVPMPPAVRSAPQAAEALMALYDGRLRQGLAASGPASRGRGRRKSRSRTDGSRRGPRSGGSS